MLETADFGYTQDCSEDITYSVTNLSTYSGFLTLATSTLQVYSTEMSLAGSQYTIEVSGVTNTAASVSFTFELYITDPCESATTLVTQPGVDTLINTLTVGTRVFTLSDSVSDALGVSNACGSYTAAWSNMPSQLS